MKYSNSKNYCLNCGELINNDGSDFCNVLCEYEYNLKRNTKYAFLDKEYVHICINCNKQSRFSTSRLSRFKTRLFSSARSDPNVWFCSKECLSEFSKKQREKKVLENNWFLLSFLLTYCVSTFIIIVVSNWYGSLLYWGNSYRT